MESAGSAPSATQYSSSVAGCKVVGSVVTVEMGADKSNVDFYVQLLNSAAWTFNLPKISGDLTNFAQKVQSTDSALPANLTAPAISSPGSTTVKVRKSFKNTMDIGTIEFDVTLSTVEEWDKECHALIQFPNYYPADGG